MRLLAAMACEQDLALRHTEQAFVQSELAQDVFMRLPPGCGSLSGKIVRLCRSLNGSKPASRQWHNHLSKCLRYMGFEQCLADSCVFRLMEDSRVIITLVAYVDMTSLPWEIRIGVTSLLWNSPRWYQ